APQSAAAVPAPQSAAAVPAPPPAAAQATVTTPGSNGAPSWLWGVVALLFVAIAILAWRLRVRKAPVPKSELDEAGILMGGRARDGSAGSTVSKHRLATQSGASPASDVPDTDPAKLRRRYIEERFPEIAGGTIAPDDPDSVVKAARLFYEDGTPPRAVELLKFAIEENPAAVKPWLALFEIYRLEGLAQEFAALAGRFREHHQPGDIWRKVQFIGRDIDPRNPLYRDAPFDNLETIGYPATKGRGPVSFDPLAENWLDAPMDFATDAFASRLRAGILADAGVNEADLVANPMPALRNIEMFTVA
ncbi:MAG TPA: hypothetical protein VFV55_06375, partial [Usitatibacteraceae bacterium]|nr:hypothetical protein [Usitatibacteraceae bacterium]